MKQKSGKKRPLTPRQNKLVRALAQGASLKQAQVKAGYTSKNEGQSGYQALKQIQEKMPQVLERLGLTDHILIEDYLKPLLKAQETKFFVINKKLVTRNVQALGTRFNALDCAFKLKGSYAPRDPAEAAQFGIKVVIVDVPRPPKFIDAGTNGHKPDEED